MVYPGILKGIRAYEWTEEARQNLIDINESQTLLHITADFLLSIPEKYAGYRRLIKSIDTILESPFTPYRDHIYGVPHTIILLRTVLAVDLLFNFIKKVKKRPKRSFTHYERCLRGWSELRDIEVVWFKDSCEALDALRQYVVMPVLKEE
jgi:hypothetical protein